MTILVPAVLVLAVVVPETRRMVTRRGLLRVLAVVVPAMAVNAWYLLPDLAYHSHTLIVGGSTSGKPPFVPRALRSTPSTSFR